MTLNDYNLMSALARKASKFATLTETVVLVEYTTDEEKQKPLKLTIVCAKDTSLKKVSRFKHVLQAIEYLGEEVGGE